MDYESTLKLIKSQHPEYSMTYQEILAKLKKDKPDLKFKQVQKEASDTYKKYQAELEEEAKTMFNKLEEARNELASEKIGPIKTTGPKPAKADEVIEKTVSSGLEKKNDPAMEPVKHTLFEGISIDALYEAEERIRAEGVSRNSITKWGNHVIPKGRMVIHGTEGPNKLVTWEDEDGNALPISGHFKVFLVNA
ncbi:MAG: hypothetical protein PHS33_08695 [Candidatus Omnitrophica bacterium]|nr:hypothetical protein [Candidatus Omnitrophota bacterium]